MNVFFSSEKSAGFVETVCLSKPAFLFLHVGLTPSENLTDLER